MGGGPPRSRVCATARTRPSARSARLSFFKSALSLSSPVPRARARLLSHPPTHPPTHLPPHQEPAASTAAEEKPPADPLALLAAAMRAGGKNAPATVAWRSAILGDERVEYVRGPDLATVLAKGGVPEIDAVAATISE